MDTNSRFYKKFNDELQKYNVDSNDILKKLYNSDNNFIGVNEDINLQKYINNAKQNIEYMQKYLEKNNFTFKLEEIKLSHYRTETDNILVDSYGDFGLKLEIKYKDNVICFRELCLDDYNFTTKENAEKNIRNSLTNLMKNYIYISSFICDKISKSQLQKNVSQLIKSSENISKKGPIEMAAQAAGRK
jgi:hypothetical protein